MLVASVKIKYDRTALCGKSIDAESKNAVSEFGALLLEDIKNRAPVDTGALRDGMTMRRKGAPSTQWVQIYSEQPYWVYNEYGARHMAGKPFIGPAIQSNLPKLKEITAQHVVNAVRVSAAGSEVQVAE